MIFQPAYNGHRDCKDLTAMNSATDRDWRRWDHGRTEPGYQIDPGRLQNQKRSKPTLSLCGGWSTISFTTIIYIYMYIYIV